MNGCIEAILNEMLNMAIRNEHICCVFLIWSDNLNNSQIIENL